MDRKMECPICKKKAVFVGVHDDEGNYHGLMGCEYENAPWSGLSYALHHEGWGDCPLCTDGAESTMGGMLFDTAEEAISALSPPNEPLTMEELRKMDGEPVYMTFPSDTGNQCGHWALVGTQRWGAVSLIYGCGWSSYESAVETLGAKFYRRPPEGEEHCYG